MRIVLTHPYCWPYVRRGAERHLADMAAYLDRRGHDVVVLSTRPRQADEVSVEGPRRLLIKQAWVPGVLRNRIRPPQTFFFSCLRQLPKLAADLVHSLYFWDGLAAGMTQRRTGHRTVLQFNGPPFPWVYPRRLPPDRWAVREAIRRADCVVAISQFVADSVREHYRVEPRIWHVPIQMEQFSLGEGAPDEQPVLLAVADFNARSKGVRVLVQAFQLLHQEVPAVRLRLSGGMSDAVRKEVLGGVSEATRQAIEVLGVGPLDELPRLYQSSSLLVLPSMWEAAGMVMFEAWASGTPVVATRHGGIPEFVTPQTGVLFDPQSNGEETHNVEGLFEALRQGLRLCRQPGVRQQCRDHAQQYSWDILGPQLESLYDG